MNVDPKLSWQQKGKTKCVKGARGFLSPVFHSCIYLTCKGLENSAVCSTHTILICKRLFQKTIMPYSEKVWVMYDKELFYKSLAYEYTHAYISCAYVCAHTLYFLNCPEYLAGKNRHMESFNFSTSAIFYLSAYFFKILKLLSKWKNYVGFFFIFS